MSVNPTQTPVSREFRERMEVATTNFVITLEQVPGWREFRRSRMRHTLTFDIAPMAKPDIFNFPSLLDDQHQVVMLYLGLAQTLHALQDCEFYFRRFPFKGLPTSRYAHATAACEMYFGRFYEFKERMKKLLNAAKLVAEGRDLLVGKFIKSFEDDFDSELRARNSIHHHGRFDDVAIDRLFISESFVKTSPCKGWQEEHMRAWRQFSKEWSARVRNRSRCVEVYLERVAEVLLLQCHFLDGCRKPTFNEIVPESTPVALPSDYSLATGV